MDTQIRGLITEGKTLREISTITGVKYETIRSFVRRNNLVVTRDTWHFGQGRKIGAYDKTQRTRRSPITGAKVTGGFTVCEVEDQTEFIKQAFQSIE